MKIDYTLYSFIAEEDWGDFYKGKYRKPNFSKKGYSLKHYVSTEGKRINTSEHKAKWIYFNGEIPEGYEIDHIIPVKNGGTNKLSNLRLVTRKENMSNTYTKENVSKAKQGNQYNKGKKQTEERIKHRAELLKGKKHSPESIEKSANGHKKKINQYDKTTGELIKTWKSATDIEKELGIDKSSIGRVCKNKVKTAGGFIWKYEL